MARNYSVTVCRTAVASATFTVEAMDADEAQRKALESASNHEFGSGQAEYGIESLDCAEKREVLFQEDNQGRGPQVAELIVGQRPLTIEAARESALWPWADAFLDAEKLQHLIENGCSSVFLSYRGSWQPATLFR
jgi:hypothetical protein